MLPRREMRDVNDPGIKDEEDDAGVHSEPKAYYETAKREEAARGNRVSARGEERCPEEDG